MDLFIPWQYDRYINDQRHWGRDADTMTRSRNRQVFYMDGHAMHFWELSTALRQNGDVFVPNTSPADEEAEDPMTCFGIDLLGVQNPDVYILYADLLSDVDQTEHELTVHNPQRPEVYFTISYVGALLRAQLDIVAGAQNYYRTLPRWVTQWVV